MCMYYYGKCHPYMVCMCLDLTAADTGVSGPSNWAVWGSAHGFTGSSVEQKKE